MKSRSRTIITRVLVFLLLGAIVNVAVAWGLVAVHGNDLIMTNAVLRGYSSWPDGAPSAWPSPERHWWWEGAGVRAETARTVRYNEADRTDPKHFREWGCRRVEAGIPLRGVWLVDWYSILPDDRDGETGLRRGVAIEINEMKTLPVMPLWPGFAINTIFYAVILWLLFAVPRPMRRWLRIKRHRCPACAYQIAPGTGAVCSECGAMLPWMRKSPT